MDIGIGLPVTIPGAKPDVAVEWARTADAGPFSSLGIIDRLVYTNYDPLISLAVAAGATQRIRLMTTILISPIHNATILAKQVATLDALSGGRLTLGLGLGGREDDYTAADAPYHGRGGRLEQQIETMKRIWNGEPTGDGIGPIGPPPAQKGGPEILIGGFSPRAIARVGKWADGFIAAGAGSSDMARQGYDAAEQAWKDAGRSGRPRFVTGVYVAIGGEDAREKAAAYITDYYGYMGDMADMMARSVPATENEVKEAIKAFKDIGVDELILWPCVAELEQVDRFANLVGQEVT
jgi:alkanesulfonate monooxygenase SsuD/methylene tetrahydromethanopterin reductase-like flavin-dependent oxidoreductase (luciferase family)